MPFGAIFGALFFAFLSFWLLFVSSDSSWAPLQAVRLFLAMLSISLTVGLLLRRSWARWVGLFFAAVTAALILIVVSHRAGVGELVVLLGSLSTAVLLAVGPTGDVRRGMAPDLRTAPTMGRIAGLATAIGVIGLGGSLWWGTQRSEASSMSASVAQPKATEVAGLPKRVRWSDFESGLAQARDENKPLLVTFVTDWCGYCRKMDRTTWNDSAVIERLSELVAVKVDAEGQSGSYSGPQLAQKYGVQGFPTTVLLDSAGRVVSRQGGYVDARKILSWLDSATRQVRTSRTPNNTIPATSR